MDLSAAQGHVAIETRDEAVATAVMAEEPSEEQRQAAGELDEPDRDRADVRLLVATAAVDQLLHPRDGPLAGCEFRLYLYDEDCDRLLPALEPDRTPTISEGWAIGQGVTGEAWRREAYVLATGRECSDDTYHLDEDQQERYRHLAAVAAAPVVSADGSVVAVLSGSSGDPNNRLGSPEGFDAHIGLAAAMARLLVDLLGWASDE